MKLFQIEEPDGSPGDADGPGAAIGIDASGAAAAVAVAVGGNAVTLSDREGFELVLPVPAVNGDWRGFLEGARIRAERALARPVTHAVLALGAAPSPEGLTALNEAALAAGMVLLKIIPAAELPPGATPAAAAAIVAEDLAPPPQP
jgi:hypothetical protein